ncbi:MAG TPA: YgiQ family radical SAM protein, partial [Clostridiales bacterium]|nr:YgiQ family radical SAM protein [Clostridiales bacterium]
VYRAFKVKYEQTNKRLGLKQFLVPYLISGHPGCDLNDAIELALEIKRNRVMPEQVQDFYPTPGTVSAVMYYTGLDPMTLQPVHVPDGAEKVLQRALLQSGKPENRDKVLDALRRAGRTDLIGDGPDKLIPKQLGEHKQEAEKYVNHHQRERISPENPQPDRRGDRGNPRRDR